MRVRLDAMRRRATTIRLENKATPAAHDKFRKAANPIIQRA
ncbi:hypothetical protein K788_00029260 [Paraburkholderia caribensis MBA4]|uniref:Uncharacterized protein n=1 Tax=Paraburkholderia caribensis MBA4 TaxID=1323664 RepID=A0A0P0RE39_9BURK|nr:hypothetical protein K788_00029260 [Paraburkholderia caribensis MBA4]